MSDGRDEALRPSDGVRFLLAWREARGDDGACYDAAIITPAERFDYEAVLAMSGAVSLAARGAPAAAEQVKKLTIIAKLVARAAQGKHDDGLPPWPRRVLRWRPA